MNKLTRKIRNKGYTLNEFCHAIGYSLRWYREHASKDNKQNELIAMYVEALPEMLIKEFKLNSITLPDDKFTRDEYGNPPGYKSTFIKDAIKNATDKLEDK